MKTEDTTALNTLLSMAILPRQCTNDRYPSKCIATSLIRHLGYQYYDGRCGREKRRRIWFQPVASEVR
jgi:hypothetical protein